MIKNDRLIETGCYKNINIYDDKIDVQHGTWANETIKNSKRAIKTNSKKQMIFKKITQRDD